MYMYPSSSAGEMGFDSSASNVDVNCGVNVAGMYLSRPVVSDSRLELESLLGGCCVAPGNGLGTDAVFDGDA